MWEFTSEFTWLKEHIERMRARAVNDMLAGLDMEQYAEKRGYVEACDDILAAPVKYARLRAREEEAEVT
jgi:5,10-methenyltetrahydromethanopterin hydrogenase